MTDRKMIERAIRLNDKQIAADEAYIQRLRALDRPAGYGDAELIAETEARIEMARKRNVNLNEALATQQ